MSTTQESIDIDRRDPIVLYHGDVVDPGGKPGELAILREQFLGVSPDGFVEFCSDKPPEASLGRYTVLEKRRVPPGCLLMPGFVDTHIHAAQVQYAGTGTDLTLMQWLTEYAFPAERRLTKDPVASERVYSGLIRSMIENGTTTALYFGVIGLESTKILAGVARRMGQRAFVGKVAMDRLSPEDYTETTEEAVARTKEFIHWTRATSQASCSYTNATEYCADRSIRMDERHSKLWLERNLPLLEPVVTPRFVPCCSETLLEQLGALAREHDCLVQSHAVESVDCLDCVESLHPGRDEVKILRAAGLLNPKSVMAHCVHITEAQADVFLETGTAIACCPLSNFYFAGGCLRIAALQQRGVGVGLGSDVAGGYSHEMLNAVRHAVTTHLCVASADAMAARQAKLTHGSIPPNTIRCDGVAPGAGAPVSRESFGYRHAFWTATVGGANALGLGGKVGRLKENHSFDACVVDVRKWLGDASPEIADTKSLEIAFEKFIHLGTKDEIQEVFVQGVPCHSVK